MAGPPNAMKIRYHRLASFHTAESVSFYLEASLCLVRLPAKPSPQPWLEIGGLKIQTDLSHLDCRLFLLPEAAGSPERSLKVGPQHSMAQTQSLPWGSATSRPGSRPGELERPGLQKNLYPNVHGSAFRKNPRAKYMPTSVRLQKDGHNVLRPHDEILVSHQKERSNVQTRTDLESRTLSERRQKATRRVILFL